MVTVTRRKKRVENGKARRGEWAVCRSEPRFCVLPGGQQDARATNNILVRKETPHVSLRLSSTHDDNICTRV